MRLAEQAVAKGEPTALACCGPLARWWADPGNAPTEGLWPRFVDGRPLSAVTTPFLAWCCEKLAAAGKTALPVVWDNAAWHVGRAVGAWIAAHNRQVKAERAGVRIVTCPLPIRSPWLNPIAPKWVHGKKRAAEPARLLTADELETRVYDALGAAHADHLSMPKQAA